MAIDTGPSSKQRSATRRARDRFRAADQLAKKTGKRADKAARADALARLITERDKLKRENFKRLAPARVDAVLDAIDRLTALANPTRYLWGVEESAMIASAITARFHLCKDQLFRVPGRRLEARRAFSLDESHAATQ